MATTSSLSNSLDCHVQLVSVSASDSAICPDRYDATKSNARGDMNRGPAGDEWGRTGRCGSEVESLLILSSGS